MKHLNFIFGYVSIIIIGSISMIHFVQSQTYKPMNSFQIGTDFVNDSKFSRWAVAPITTLDSIRPQVWIDLKDLGITMPQFHINNPNSTWPQNLVQAAKNNGLQISLNDELLSQASRWERRYFQVEAKEHFSSNSVGQQVIQTGFKQDGLPFDVHPKDYRTSSPPNNGILFKQDDYPTKGTTITGFKHRDSLYMNGRYYITLRLGIYYPPTSLPPDDATPIVRVRMLSDGTTMDWAIPGSAFYDGAGNPRYAFEYLLRTETDTIPAMIVLRADTLDFDDNPSDNQPTLPIDSVRYTVVPDTTGWGAGHYNRDDDYPPNYPARYLPKRDSTMQASDFDIEIVYLGVGDIFIDALCFSDPQAFGFFVGDDNALPNFCGDTLLIDEPDFSFPFLTSTTNSNTFL